MTFCQWLQERRANLGVSQTSVSMVTGIPRSTVAALEVGRLTPNTAHLFAVATWARCEDLDDAKALASAFVESKGNIDPDDLPPGSGDALVLAIANAVLIHSNCG